jgi:hypothetical protein
MASYRINLATTLGCTDWITVPPDVTKAAISIALGSSFSWGSAVVDLQHTFSRGMDKDGNQLENAQNFSPAIQFDTDTTYRRNVSIGGTHHIRLKTTTAAGASDPNAQVVVMLS